MAWTVTNPCDAAQPIKSFIQSAWENIIVGGDRRGLEYTFLWFFLINLKNITVLIKYLFKDN